MVSNIDNYMYSLGSTYIPAALTVYERDFRNFQKGFLNGFQQLCTLSQETVDNSITMFLASPMFVNRVMSRIQFTKEMNVTLNQFMQNTPIEFAQTLNIIRTTTQANALLGLFSSNWKLVKNENDTGGNTSFYSEPIGNIDTEKKYKLFMCYFTNMYHASTNIYIPGYVILYIRRYNSGLLYTRKQYYSHHCRVFIL